MDSTNKMKSFGARFQVKFDQVDWISIKVIVANSNLKQKTGEFGYAGKSGSSSASSHFMVSSKCHNRTRRNCS